MRDDICCHMRSLAKYHFEASLTAYSWMLICSICWSQVGDEERDWEGSRMQTQKCHRSLRLSLSSSQHLLPEITRCQADEATSGLWKGDFVASTWLWFLFAAVDSILFWPPNTQKQCCIEKKHKDFTFKTQHTLRCESWGFMCSVSLHCEYE